MVQYSLSILTFGEVIMNKPFIAIEGPIGPSIAINGLFIITSPNVKIDNEYCTISEVFQHI